MRKVCSAETEGSGQDDADRAGPGDGLPCDGLLFLMVVLLGLIRTGNIVLVEFSGNPSILVLHIFDQHNDSLSPVGVDPAR